MTTAPTPTVTAKAKRVLRPDIQALRAAAVLVVLAYHLWPASVRGGFVGVDVFFVISGFLITAHLVREVDATGRISLSRFWARRVRRLLPASLLVLVVSGIVTALFVPSIYWQQFFKEIAASALYVQNWILAADAVDYLAAENLASPVQHFWSLSAEEQFYFVWPLLIVASVALVARRPQWRRPMIAVTLALVTLVSLAFSVYWTARYAPSAYFITPTRAWEFGAGGCLALLAASTARPRARAAVSWLGWAAIAVSVVTFTGALPFPSYTALLPVVGTLLVIWAGAPEVSWSPTALVSWRPIQFVGDISYSVYLWHWPLIVLLPLVLNVERTLGMDLAIIAATLVLAWLTSRFVEDPFRERSVFARGPAWLTFTAMLGALVLIVGGSGIAWTSITPRIEAAQQLEEQLVADGTDCFGAAALESACADAAPVSSIVPDPLGAVRAEGCNSLVAQPELKPCVTERPAGAPDNGAVAVIGDSHADALFAMVETLGADRGWDVHHVTKSSCPLTDALRGDEVNPNSPGQSSCIVWNEGVVDYLDERPGIHTLFVSASAINRFVPEDGEDWFETGVAGYRSAWAGLPESVTSIVVIRDVPRARIDFIECVDRNRVDPNAECGIPVGEGLHPDPQAEAALDDSDPRTTVVDLTDRFCVDGECLAVVGGVLVYRDSHHVTDTYARTLAPFLGERLDELAADTPGAR